jgi:hypothetical protein
LCLGNTTLNHSITRGVETGLDDPLHDDRAVGRILTRLNHNGVTGGDSANDWAESQLEWEVEGAVGEERVSVAISARAGGVPHTR